MRVRQFWNNNYIEYKRNGDRNKNLLVKEYLNESKTYLKRIITDLQKSGTWKTQLTIAINFISSKHTGEKKVMHCKSVDTMVKTYDNQ